MRIVSVPLQLVDLCARARSSSIWLVFFSTWLEAEAMERHTTAFESSRFRPRRQSEALYQVVASRRTLLDSSRRSLDIDSGNSAVSKRLRRRPYMCFSLPRHLRVWPLVLAIVVACSQLIVPVWSGVARPLGRVRRGDDDSLSGELLFRCLFTGSVFGKCTFWEGVVNFSL